MSQSAEITADQESTDSLWSQAKFFNDRRASIAGGALMLLVLGLGYWLLNTYYSGAETREIAAAITQSALYYGAALITASLTVIALMLNAVGTARKLETEFDSDIYSRVFRITCYATLMGLAAVVMMLALCAPILEVDGLPKNWYTIYYHGLVALIALNCGLMVTTLLELFTAVRRILRGVIA